MGQALVLGLEQESVKEPLLEKLLEPLRDDPSNLCRYLSRVGQIQPLRTVSSRSVARRSVHSPSFPVALEGAAELRRIVGHSSSVRRHSRADDRDGPLDGGGCRGSSKRSHLQASEGSGLRKPSRRRSPDPRQADSRDESQLMYGCTIVHIRPLLQRVQIRRAGIAVFQSALRRSIRVGRRLERSKRPRAGTQAVGVVRRYRRAVLQRSAARRVDAERRMSRVTKRGNRAR